MWRLFPWGGFFCAASPQMKPLAAVDGTVEETHVMSDDLASQKQTLRARMRLNLRELHAPQVADWSVALMERLLTLAASWPPERNVALFGGLKAEPDLLSDLLPKLVQMGHRGVLFAIEGDHLEAYEVRLAGDAVRGMMRVWEPVRVPARRLALSQIDVVLTPGLAFGTEDGSRLGRGRGFYDRFFAEAGSSVVRIGVGWDLQLLPKVPSEPHDAVMNALVTPTRCMDFP